MDLDKRKKRERNKALRSHCSQSRALVHERLMHSTDNTHSIALCLSTFLSLDHIVQVMLYHCNRFYCSNINIQLKNDRIRLRHLYNDCCHCNIVCRMHTFTHTHTQTQCFFRIFRSNWPHQVIETPITAHLSISLHFFRKKYDNLHFFTSNQAYYTHSSLNITIVSVIVHWKWCLSNNKTTFVIFPQEFVCVQMNILLQFKQFRVICSVMNFQASFSLKNWFKTNFPSDLFLWTLFG